MKMKRIMLSAGLLFVAAAATAALGQAKPINANCPLKSDQGAKANITSVYEGVTFGFCCGMCKKTFDGDPEGVAARVPEYVALLKAKKSSKPEEKGPCDTKKFVKGWYCEECKRELKPDDVRGSVCKRCEEKPLQIEYCLKVVVHPQTPDQIKKKMAPRVEENLSRVSYACDSCDAKASFEKDLKHKEDCKPKFGSGLRKICSKSGQAPHSTTAK
jgi:YHS domain-containing protein